MKFGREARVEVRGREASAEVDRELHCPVECLIIP